MQCIAKHLFDFQSNQVDKAYISHLVQLCQPKEYTVF